MKYEIDSNRVGEDFCIKLAKLISIRAEKRAIYGDTYLQDSKDFFLLQIENKLKRVKIHLENKTESNNIEKCEDNLLDLAIYSLFLSSVLEKEKEND